MDDGFLHPAHIAQSGTFQKQSLHAVTVQLNGFGPQIQCSRIALTVEAVAPGGGKHPPQKTKQLVSYKCIALVIRLPRFTFEPFSTKLNQHVNAATPGYRGTNESKGKWKYTAHPNPPGNPETHAAIKNEWRESSSSYSPRYYPGFCVLIRDVKQSTTENFHVLQMSFTSHKVAVHIHA